MASIPSKAWSVPFASGPEGPSGPFEPKGPWGPEGGVWAQTRNKAGTGEDLHVSEISPLLHAGPPLARGARYMRFLRGGRSHKKGLPWVLQTESLLIDHHAAQRRN